MIHNITELNISTILLSLPVSKEVLFDLFVMPESKIVIEKGFVDRQEISFNVMYDDRIGSIEGTDLLWIYQLWESGSYVDVKARLADDSKIFHAPHCRIISFHVHDEGFVSFLIIVEGEYNWLLN